MVETPVETTQKPAKAKQQQQTPGTTQFLKGVIAFIFYAGLTIFLLGSIDHVAWFFHLYEPADTWTVPSYIKAGSLDLAVFFLAYSAATGETADKVITWTFTILLSAISLFANYLYAMWFSPEKQTHIWNVEILWGTTTTGWLSPLIASSYPLFAIVFMYLIERVISRRAETADEMRDRLATLKEKKQIEKQIKAITKGEATDAINDIIDNGLNVFSHFRQQIGKPGPDQIITDSSERHTDNLEALTDDSLGDHETDHTGEVPDSLGDHETDHATASNGFTGRSYIPIDEAAQLLMIEPATAHSLRRNGTLKCHPINKRLITFASIRDYDNRRPANKRTLIEGSPANLEKLMKQAANTPGVGIDKLNLTLQILRENPDITDEELAERLSLKRPPSARFWRLKAYEIIQTASKEQEMNA